MALVHDWITGLRGGERVLHELLELFPEADLYTLFYEAGTTTSRIDERPVTASALNRRPWIRARRRWALPLYPWAMSRLHATRYDLVLSIHHAVAKSISLAAGTPHLCYCLTPMRYVWDQTSAYQGRGLARLAALPLSTYLRAHDRATAGEDHVTRFVAISRCVAERVERHYGRRASILHPPVDVARFARARPRGATPNARRSAPYLLVTSFTGYKRPDIAIDAALRLGREVWVVGDGPGRRRLQDRSGGSPLVRFLGRVEEDDLPSLYAECRALLQPQEEDFGIAALEAQAAGRAVIAYDRGGATETVLPAAGPDASAATGVWFSRQSADAMADAILRFETLEDQFDPGVCLAHAERFDVARFHEGMRFEVDQLLDATERSA